MGGSQSSNVANAIASVSSKISQNTTANASQSENIRQQIILNNCTIKSKNLNIDESSKTIQSNTQISKALQNSSVSNDIQQALLQSATSSVGAMGIGFSDATNSASMFVNSASDIINSLSEICNQYSSTDSSFLCDNSTIISDNVNISMGTEKQFLSSQTLDNSQVAQISNKISQKADQKATATVEGLTGLIIAFAILIIAFGYSLTKPLDTAASKIIIVVIVLFILMTIFAFMYIKETPPFFNENNECLPFELKTCNSDCIDQTQKTISTNGIPLRYIYGLTKGDPDPSKSGANLMQMVISFCAGNKPINGCYNYNNFLLIESKIRKYDNYAKLLNIPPLPNLLVVPNSGNLGLKIPDEYLGGTNNGNPRMSLCTPSSIIIHDPTATSDFSSCPSIGNITETTSLGNYAMASLNYNEKNTDDTNWFGYLSNDPNQTKAKFARYVLCDLLQIIPLSVYIEEDELVNIYKDDKHQTGKAGDNKNDCYKLELSIPYDFRSAITSNITSKISGKIGVCNDTTYKFHNFMTKIGIWILITLLVAFIGYMIYTTYIKKESDNNDVKKK